MPLFYIYFQIEHFPFDKFLITELILIHKNISKFVTRMCKFIGHSDVKHIMMSPIRLAEILAIMFVSTFNIAVILYLLLQSALYCINKCYCVYCVLLTILVSICRQSDICKKNKHYIIIAF